MTECEVRFVPVETAHLVFATILLAATFAIAYQWNFLLALSVGAFGLIVHELGHKIAGSVLCVRDTHFAISPIGIFLGYLTSFGIGHALVSPGGVTVDEGAPGRKRMWMALAGPATNVLLFVVFYGLHVFAPVTADFGVGGRAVDVDLWLAIASVNLYLAVFNLLPIPAFDGSHVLDHNPWVWAISMVVTVSLTVLMWGTLSSTIEPLFTGTWGGVISIVGIETVMVPLVPGLLILHSDKISLPDAIVTGGDEYYDPTDR